MQERNLHLADLLAHRASEGRLAHAFLVVGSSRGEGLAFCSRVLQHLFCRQANKPCGECSGCRSVINRAGADVIWTEPESKSRQITGEQMREVNKRLAQSSYSGGWKCAVILDADRLNDTSANAFLKTLEEPAGQSLIFLVTDSPQVLLPTIRSRCQTIAVGMGEREMQDEWAANLKDLLRRGVPDSLAGRLMLAFELAAMLDEERSRVEEAINEELEDQDPAEEEVESKKLEARIESEVRRVRAQMLETILLWQRDMLLAIEGSDCRTQSFPDVCDCILEQVQGLSTNQVIRRIRATEEMIRRLERNIRPEQAFIAWLFRMKAA